MSWTLAKRGLDLFDDDVLTPSSCNLKKPRVSTHRHGLHRAAKQKKRIQQEKKAIRNQLVQKQVTNALKEYKKGLPIDQTKKNIKLLKKIDGKISATYVEKITKYHEKSLVERLTRLERRERAKKKKEEQASVFTDEDFARVNVPNVTSAE